MIKKLLPFLIPIAILSGCTGSSGSTKESMEISNRLCKSIDSEFVSTISYAYAKQVTTHIKCKQADVTIEIEMSVYK